MKTLTDALWRAVYRGGFRLALLYWHLWRPRHRGALVAIWAAGCLLLVRQSYRHALSLPGGGVRAGEETREAAWRELVEELGLQVAPSALRPVFEACGIFDGRPDKVAFFELHIESRPAVVPDRREVVQVLYADRAALGSLKVTAPVACYLAWLEADQGSLPRRARRCDHDAHP